ncbi:MAG TPA: DUF4236 domain-containing protein [Gemmatimonadaceae bacterium]|nr:DUF4236 domain-containing protein [Gemmatimonadaceae bacterium]
MALRFRRSISIIPGVRLNLSKSGLSTSIGPRGASLTIGPRGAYTNVGIPGTGIYARQRIGSVGVAGRARARTREQRAAARAAQHQAALEEHAAAQAKLHALGSVLQHRVRAPFDWSALIAPKGAFVVRPFVPPSARSTADDAQRAARDAVPVVPWVVLFVVGACALLVVVPIVMRLAGLAALIVAGVMLSLVSGRRTAFAAHWLSEQQRAHDAAVEAAHAAHDEAERHREADWDAAADLRERLRTAVERSDAEPLTHLLEVELSNEQLPVPLIFAVDFDGTSAVEIDLVLPALDAIPGRRTSITKAGKLSRRRMAQHDRTALYGRLCCGMTLRLAYEAFRVLPMLRQITERGTACGIDPATGHERRFDALRLDVRREQLAALELDRLEPRAAIEQLGGRFGCDARGTLRPVD